MIKTMPLFAGWNSEIHMYLGMRLSRGGGAFKCRAQIRDLR